ncbi:MAG: Gfo/Idh/MocA family oxidoreductase [bacterium]|nr:Gfo/Idh/MocA family oxidoreductase [bacterium]MCP4964659.1 Gfo/Idh/MocA family oxidoreductase [bacterium]
MRAGIFGVGHVHSESYVENLRAARGVEFVGAAETDRFMLADWTKRHHAFGYASDDELIAAGVDFGIVCSPTNAHLPTVERMAAAGVHVLCEKPLATNVDDAQRIVDVCAAAGVHLMTAFPMRFSPSLATGAEWIREGRIGEVLAITGTNRGHLPTGYAPWFADLKLAGGGAVMDHTVHLADVMRWWLGNEPDEVYAETNRILHPEVAVETGGLVTVGFESGVFATIDCSWSRPDNYPTWGGLEIEAVGTEGVFTVDAFAQRFDVWSNGQTSWVDWGSDTNQLMIDHFVGAVRGDHPVAVTGFDGLRATEVALAAYRSAERGQPVVV